MDKVTTTNHSPEKPKEQLYQRVMELDSRSADCLKKLEKSWKPGMRFTLSGLRLNRNQTRR